MEDLVITLIENYNTILVGGLILRLLIAIIILLFWVTLWLNVYGVKKLNSNKNTKAIYFKAQQTLFAGNKAKAKELYLMALFVELKKAKVFKNGSLKEKQQFVEDLFKARKFILAKYEITENDIETSLF